MKFEEINVKGMHCTSCEMLIKDTLLDENGVKKVSAHYEKGIVEVEFNEDKINHKKIKKLIEEDGFKVA